jgi:hypothetical protein
MNRITLAIVGGVLALIVVGAWAWRGRQESRSIETPREVASAPSPPAEPLELTAPSIAPEMADARAPITAPAAVPAAKPSEFALVRVLVVAKEDDRPLAGVVVTASHETKERSRAVEKAAGRRGKPFESITTGVDGRVEIEMPLGVASHLDADGWSLGAGPQRASLPALAAGDVHDVTLRLPVGDDLPFWLQILAEETHVGIAGAIVEVERERTSLSKDLVTDERGIVFHAGRTWMNSKLIIRADRRGELHLRPVPGHETAGTALVVELPLAADLRLEVRDGSGAGFPGARVFLSVPNHQLRLDRTSVGVTIWDLGDRTWTEATDASGVARFSNLPVRVPVKASLITPKDWQPAEPFVFEPGESRTVTWTLSTGCTLRGVLLDQDGLPVARRSMALAPAQQRRNALFSARPDDKVSTTTSDADGRFAFDDLAPGAWLVGPAAADAKQIQPNDVAPLGQFVQIDAGQRLVEVTLRVDRGLFIRGRLVASDGGVPKGGFVTATNRAQSLWTGTQAERSDGTFALGPLMSGRYEIQGRASPDALSDPIEVEAGADGVEIRLKAGARLAGRIAGAASDSVGGKITCSLHVPHPTTTLSTNIRNGAFDLKGLQAGTYDLAIVCGDGSVGLLEGIVLQDGETRAGLTVQLAPGGSVRVRHDGPDQFVSVAILQRGALVVSDGLERGDQRSFGAPAGSVTVRMTYRGGAPRTVERVVEVAAGKTVDVVFEKDAK